jgi:uncharacterized protein (DUF1330 family)
VLAILRAEPPRRPARTGSKERIVITEFPSLERAKGAYESPVYKEALKALGDGAVRDVRIIEGSE